MTEKQTPVAFDLGSGEGKEPVIVVGVDSSPTARMAAEKAAELARKFGARLHLVSAVKQGGLEMVQGPGDDTWEVDLAGPTNDMLVGLSRAWPDLNVTWATIVGKPAEAIVSEAETFEAVLIVVGNKRMGGIGRILGAIAADVAHRAPCDVYIVKTTD